MKILFNLSRFLRFSSSRNTVKESFDDIKGATESRIIFVPSSSLTSRRPCKITIEFSVYKSSNFDNIFGKTITSILAVKSSIVIKAIFVFERVNLSFLADIIPTIETSFPS